jgi:hypothetical protein
MAWREVVASRFRRKISDKKLREQLKIGSRNFNKEELEIKKSGQHLLTEDAEMSWYKCFTIH